MHISEILQYGFMQRAFIAGSLIGVLCSILGMFLVLRRFSLIGDGLAHVSFAGIAVGLLVNVTPLYVALPLVMISSLGIIKLADREHIHGDTAIGIVSAVGIALGIMIVTVTEGTNVDIFSYLFGSILAISKMEIVLASILSIVVLLTIFFFYHELVYLTFDEECAKVSGIKTGLINKVLVLLTAITVVLAMKVVGILLVSALLILPAVTALQQAKSFRLALVISCFVALFSISSGILLSFIFNWPAGPSIVLFSFLLFLISFIFRRKR